MSYILKCMHFFSGGHGAASPRGLETPQFSATSGSSAFSTRGLQTMAHGTNLAHEATLSMTK